MEKNIKFEQNTPLWDNSLSIEERLDYLTGAMTLEEKIHCLTTGCPDIPRLGIRATYMGGEAAHGIEARHDQAFNKGEPEPTTAFTQPIGMSASFDRELIRECGRAVGEEARALYTRNGGGGLCRWAPTIDMERDPRWGRTEESYSTFHEVMGVLQDYKHRINEQPGNLLVQVNGKVENHSWIQWVYMLTFKLKPNVDVSTFEKRFKAEVVPQLNVGNFYFTKLGRFADIRRKYENESGVTNTLRLQYSLAGFALLCVFLGMVGTFWIRCNARRQDIGLMRSMGATKKVICNQFLMEAWLLVTIAFVVSLPLTMHRIYVSGFANPSENGNPVYWQNQPLTHFLIVSVLAYIVLLVIALLGTYAPVTRTAKILPAEALRDE